MTSFEGPDIPDSLKNIDEMLKEVKPFDPKVDMGRKVMCYDTKKIPVGEEGKKPNTTIVPESGKW